MGNFFSFLIAKALTHVSELTNVRGRRRIGCAFHRRVLGFHIFIVLMDIVFPIGYRHLVQHVERNTNIFEASEKLVFKVLLIRRRY